MKKIIAILTAVVLFALPCAMGFFLLSEPMLRVLYSDANASVLLQKLSLAVVFVALVSVSNAVLQAYGKVYVPVVNMLVGGVIKVLMNYFFIPIWGIDAAPIATTACYGVIAVLNIICIISMLKIRLSFVYMVIKPVIASVIMGAAALLSYNLLSQLIPGSRIVTFMSIAIAAVVYAVALVFVRCLRKDDILNLPKGAKIAEIM